jgi:hypothetical protein
VHRRRGSDQRRRVREGLESEIDLAVQSRPAILKFLKRGREAATIDESRRALIELAAGFVGKGGRRGESIRVPSREASIRRIRRMPRARAGGGPPGRRELNRIILDLMNREDKEGVARSGIGRRRATSGWRTSSWPRWGLLQGRVPSCRTVKTRW